MKKTFEGYTIYIYFNILWVAHLLCSEETSNAFSEEMLKFQDQVALKMEKQQMDLRRGTDKMENPATKTNDNNGKLTKHE